MSTSLSEIRKQLATLPFWGALTAVEQRTMESCVQIRKYEQDTLIYSKEQECLGLILVLSGKIRIFMLSEEGREIQLYTVSLGETDVLSASCVMNQITFETQMVADTDCSLLIVPAVCLSNFKENNLHVRCFLLEKLGERFSDAIHKIQAILFTRVDGRIAHVLLNKVQNNKVCITHEQLAREINSTREVVSRVLKKFERKGIIRLGRGSITVLDRSELADLIGAKD